VSIFHAYNYQCDRSKRCRFSSVQFKPNLYEFFFQDTPDGCLVSVPYRPRATPRRDVTAAAQRSDVIDYSGGVLAATMTSSPQSLADSALGAEGDYSTSPDQKEFRQEDLRFKQNHG
jgi:hypothetical protein